MDRSDVAMIMVTLFLILVFVAEKHAIFQIMFAVFGGIWTLIGFAYLFIERAQK